MNPPCGSGVSRDRHHPNCGAASLSRSRLTPLPQEAFRRWPPGSAPADPGCAAGALPRSRLAPLLQGTGRVASDGVGTVAAAPLLHSVELHEPWSTAILLPYANKMPACAGICSLSPISGCSLGRSCAVRLTRSCRILRPQGHHQHIPVRGPRRVLRGDRRDPVEDPAVVDQR